MKTFSRRAGAGSLVGGTPNSLDASPASQRTRSAVKHAGSPLLTGSPAAGSPGVTRAAAARSGLASAPASNGTAAGSPTTRRAASKRKAENELLDNPTKVQRGGVSDNASPSTAEGKPKVFTRRGRSSPLDAAVGSAAAGTGPIASPGIGTTSLPVKVRNVVPVPGTPRFRSKQYSLGGCSETCVCDGCALELRLGGGGRAWCLIRTRGGWSLAHVQCGICSPPQVHARAHHPRPIFICLPQRSASIWHIATATPSPSTHALPPPAGRTPEHGQRSWGLAPHCPTPRPCWGPRRQSRHRRQPTQGQRRRPV